MTGQVVQVRSFIEEIRDELLRCAPQTLGRSILIEQADAMARELERRVFRQPVEWGTHEATCRCTRELSCFVGGIPRTKGSYFSVFNPKRGRRQLVDDNDYLGEWKERVHLVVASRRAQVIGRDALPADVAVGLSLVFVFPRPLNHTSWGKTNRGQLRPWAPEACITAPGGGRWPNGPDLDKLYRAIGDCLKAAAVIADDRQINHLHEPFSKEWAAAAAWWGDEPGVHIRVTW